MIKKWLSKLFKKSQPEQPLEGDVDYMGYTVVDESTGMLLSIVMVCGCGMPVAKLDDDGKFYCEHCDRVCTDRPCQFCEAHFLFDAEAMKAEAASFQYDEDEEEE